MCLRLRLLLLLERWIPNTSHSSVVTFLFLIVLALNKWWRATSYPSWWWNKRILLRFILKRAHFCLIIDIIDFLTFITINTVIACWFWTQNLLIFLWSQLRSTEIILLGKRLLRWYYFWRIWSFKAACWLQSFQKRWFKRSLRVRISMGRLLLTWCIT